MPGKSKKGGGLEVKSAYKKQKFGTPFTMKGYTYPGTAPTKNRRTKSTAITPEKAAEHNALPATDDHFGHPHGPKPGSTPPAVDEKKKT